MTQTELAKFLGLTDSVLSEIISGKREISKNIAKQIKQRTGLSLDIILENSGKDVMEIVKQKILVNS